MANLFIGKIDAELLRKLKVKGAQEGITLKDLVVPLLEMAVNSKPVVYAGDFVSQQITAEEALERIHATQTEDVQAGPHAPQGAEAVSKENHRPDVRQLERPARAKESHGINCRCFQCRKK